MILHAFFYDLQTLQLFGVGNSHIKGVVWYTIYTQ